MTSLTKARRVPFYVGQLATTPYSDITKLVAGYNQPIPLEIVQRYKFNTRVRASGELIATYVAALRELSEYCNYGDRLHEMLRDRLVCGVNHDTIQRKLLAETDLTYEKACMLAQIEASLEREIPWTSQGQQKQQCSIVAFARSQLLQNI